METSEAREHLEIVDRVLSQADQTVFVGGDIFLVWGIASGSLDVVFQLGAESRIGVAWYAAVALAFALAIVYTIIRVRGLSSHSKRMSRAQYEYLNVLWLVFGITAVASSAAFNIFSGWSAAALWTIAAAIVTAYIAIHGNRRAAVGAVILIASLVAASFMPHVPGYVLAAGMLVGYSGFGLATMLARD
ncbi:MAG TPA: hypothetical protein VII69_03210 [Candidatus Eremiobacteraceae bacterium]